MAKGEPKTCPSCDRECSAGAKYCAGCGGEFKGSNVGSDGGALEKRMRRVIREELKRARTEEEEPVGETVWD